MRFSPLFFVFLSHIRNLSHKQPLYHINFSLCKKPPIFAIVIRKNNITAYLPVWGATPLGRCVTL